MRDIIKATKTDETHFDLMLNGDAMEILQVVEKVLLQVAQSQRATGNTRDRVALGYKLLCNVAVDEAFRDENNSDKMGFEFKKPEMSEDIKAGLTEALFDMLRRGMR